MNILFSNKEKELLKNYKYAIENNAITSEYLDSFWNKIQTYIPSNVSPNMISIMGFMSTFLAFLSCYYLYDLYPRVTEILTVIFVLLYANLDSIDGIHARATDNSSPLGEFIDHALDSFSTIFLIFCACKIFGISELHNVWATIQCTQLAFLMCHLNAYTTGKIYFSRYFGPTEVLFYWCILISLKIFDFTIINDFCKEVQGCAIIILYVYTYYILKFCKNEVSKKSMHMALFVPIGILMSLYSTQKTSFYMLLSCLPFAMMTLDLILCKMTQKNMSPFVLLVFIISKYNLYLSTILIIIYFGTVLWEISTYLNIPIFKMKHKQEENKQEENKTENKQEENKTENKQEENKLEN